MKPRILVIDDEKPMVETYRRYLRKDGYEIVSVTTAAEAREVVKAPDGWDVILLDQRLQGSADLTNSGLGLLGELQAAVPDAFLIVVTGYPDRESIKRGFAQGAGDYLEKNEFLEPLLTHKVRKAVAAVRDRRLSARAPSGLETELASTWAEARAEADPHRKGEALERTLVILFKTIPGLQNASPNRQNDIEEIDVMVRNEAEDPWLHGLSPYIFVECKNWSKPVGVDPASRFLWKLHHSNGMARIGVFVAMTGFTAPFMETLRRESSGDKLVLPLDADGLDAWIKAPDRVAHLKGLIDHTVV